MYLRTQIHVDTDIDIDVEKDMIQTLINIDVSTDISICLRGNTQLQGGLLHKKLLLVGASPATKLLFSHGKGSLSLSGPSGGRSMSPVLDSYSRSNPTWVPLILTAAPELMRPSL